MPRLFSRLITFKVEGEIYDNETTPESILKNYNWSFRDNSDDKLFLVASHKDHRGRITCVTKTGKIQKCNKKDTNYFII